MRSTLILVVSLAASVAALLAVAPPARGQELLVANETSGTVGAYNAATGATINASLVTGLSQPHALAISGGNLFVSNWASGGKIGEYNASTGGEINSALISGSPAAPEAGGILVSGNDLYLTVGSLGVGTSPEQLNEFTTSGNTVSEPFITLPANSDPYGIAEAGNILYVAIDYSQTTAGQGVIAEYNATTGAVINADFITGLNLPEGIWLSGNNLYVANNAATSFPPPLIGIYTNGTIGEYNATTGAAINASLISGLNQPAGVAVLGNDLFVSSYPTNVLSTVGQVGEYDATTGAAINANFITGLADPQGLFVLATPEPSTLALLAIGAGALLACGRRRPTAANLDSCDSSFPRVVSPRFSTRLDK